MASTALPHGELTQLAQDFAKQAVSQAGKSGFRVIPVGADGFLVRMQLVRAAERTLDLQYFIFEGDNTGRLLTGAVLHAAERGVRVRILIDDGETQDGDEQLIALEASARIEIRIFNPFAYRGHWAALRAIEFALNSSRLDYRMHNKLLVADNAIALIGGRNIGDAYFQIDPEGQFADDDVFAVGPVVEKLSATFDEFWNSPLAIPVQALSGPTVTRGALNERREKLREDRHELVVQGVDYATRVSSGEPFNSLLTGRLALFWAPVEIVYDSPDKKDVESGAMLGRLMHRRVAQVAEEVQREFLMVTPYLVPGKDGMRLLHDLRARGVRVRILTNSLESSTVLLAQSGYMRYRVPMLEMGVELFEIRSLLGNSRGSGQTPVISLFGSYSLHAKLFVFDRQKIFVGSMNFDQRSLHLNTEIGLIIDSAELAQQIAARFDAMIQPENAYEVLMQPALAGLEPLLRWRTAEEGRLVDYAQEPARSSWQRWKATFFKGLPFDREL